MAEGECTGKHFVDKHRSQLIDRVSDVAPILDQLLDENVIRQGCYDEILAIPTTRDKMRKLYSGPLNAAGPVGKDVFYKILEKYEPFLIDELKKKK
ncbi:apoptosis-associated speck-like protein containing a CARD isoform X1 [Sebastes fasciatus]|uniref:apoptosis-associated speck-like protein containing a CARD isoform X1 n=1 Tax=Sebastes fasciatus TaxID=394691 RepID=UPI003D9E3D08